MQKLRSFFLTAVLGGLTVILPMAIIYIVFNWLFKRITHFIDPVTNIVVNNFGLPNFVADFLVLAIILGVCFIVGLIERTKLGSLALTGVEKLILIRVPGYTIVKETILQFIGDKKNPFGAVALVKPFGPDVEMTGFITDEHKDGSFTVFVPTGPNPTSGNIFHLKENLVRKVDVSSDAAMRSIIACGAGSSSLKGDLLN